MKKILLACSAGMSTSLLVTNMEREAQKLGIDIMIKAVPVATAEEEARDGKWDIILLGPQVRFQLNTLKERIGEKIPVEVIDMRDYGMMNGPKVLKEALDKIGYSL